jgi:hypothetical protein
MSRTSRQASGGCQSPDCVYCSRRPGDLRPPLAFAAYAKSSEVTAAVASRRRTRIQLLTSERENEYVEFRVPNGLQTLFPMPPFAAPFEMLKVESMHMRSCPTALQPGDCRYDAIL